MVSETQRLLLVLFLGSCQQLPDNPEIHDASVVMTVMHPGGFARVMVACPQGAPIVTMPAKVKR